MNRPLKRLLALAGSIFIGLVGAVAFAAPAQAHHTNVSGVAECQSDGQFKITWTVAHGANDNDNWFDRYAKIKGLTPDPAGTIDGIVIDQIIQGGESAVGTQFVPGNTLTATLSVNAKWFEPGDDDNSVNESTNSGSATGLDGDCVPEPDCVEASQAQYQHTFDGLAGNATVELKGDLPLCEGDSQDFLLVSYYAPDEDFAVPQYAYDHDVDTITDETRSIELDVDIPPCWTQVDLVWGGEEELLETLVEGGPRYGDKKLGSGGPPGNRSDGDPAWYNGPGELGQKCTTPKAMFVDNCDGTVTVHLSNSEEDAKYDAVFTVKADGFEQEVTVAPGEAEQVTVPAGAGEILVNEWDETTDPESVKYRATHTWERPEDCPPPTLVAESTCTEFILKISNPEGNQSLDAVAKYGDAEKNVTIAPGTTETVTFPAGEHESVATVTIDGYEDLAGLYEKPENCDLPKTGAATATYIAGGTGLVALGAVLFLFARRHLNRLRRLAA